MRKNIWNLVLWVSILIQIVQVMYKSIVLNCQPNNYNIYCAVITMGFIIIEEFRNKTN